MLRAAWPGIPVYEIAAFSFIILSDGQDCNDAFKAES